MMTSHTLRELFRNSTESFGPLPVFSMYGGEGMTYAGFAAQVESVRELLVGAGLVPGDKVALLSSNSPGWPVCYFAAATSGMVIVPILPDFSPSELDMILRHCEAKALCVSDRLFTKVPQKTLAKIHIVIRTKNLSVLSQNVESRGHAADPRPEDVASIIYTSGTTSTPKGVMLTHANLCAQIDMAYKLFPIVAQDVLLSILPLSHTYECSIGMLYPYSCGASVVYLDKPPTAAVLMPALQAVRPTIMMSVPLVIEKIYRNQVLKRMTEKKWLSTLYGWGWLRRQIHARAGIRLAKVFGGRLRFFGVGGAKLDPQTEQFLMDAHFPYAIGYGLTETAPLLAGAVPGKTRLGSTGPVLEGIAWRLDGVNPHTGEGELLVKSPSTMAGYFKNPEATQDVFTTDGWFRTKDLASVDPDGYIHIRGRLGNMIVGPGGENIYPEEIEHVINGHMLVADSIVREDDRGKLVALVHFNREELERKYHHMKEEWRNRMDEIKEELMQYVNSKVNKFSRISVVVEQEDSFEKTPTHKIKRYLYLKNKKSARRQPARRRSKAK